MLSSRVQSPWRWPSSILIPAVVPVLVNVFDRDAWCRRTLLEGKWCGLSGCLGGRRRRGWRRCCVRADSFPGLGGDRDGRHERNRLSSHDRDGSGRCRRRWRFNLRVVDDGGIGGRFWRGHDSGSHYNSGRRHSDNSWWRREDWEGWGRRRRGRCGRCWSEQARGG